MNYATVKPLDIANGPGVRVSLFVSGCRRYCRGCFNKEAWDFTYGSPFTIRTLLEIDDALENDAINGLSILGGDPFEPENREIIAAICEYIKFKHRDKNIWCWTGYLWEDIKDLDIVSHIDVLVDGPFMEDLKDLRLKWRGSSNQRVIDVVASSKTGEVVLLEE